MAGHEHGTPTHVVISKPVDAGTQVLRDIIEEVGGVIPASRLLNLAPEQLAVWTRDGLPKHLWVVAEKLRKKLGTTIGVPQASSCYWDQSFPLAT